PVAAVRSVLPAWVAIPYLVTAFGGLLLSNHLSVYSAGLTTLTLGIRIKRVNAVILDVVVTTIGAIYFMLIAESFYGPFITFISLLAVPITAWVGVFVVDMISRRTYHPDSLMDLRRTSGYWYTGGIEWRSTFAWAVAIVIGYLFSEAKVSDHEVWFTGALAETWIGSNGLAWVATFVIAAGLYAALGGARAGRRDPSAVSS
ncbi:MAG: cytosine permease, partial [Actinomycetaceae bacterium]